MLDRINFKTKIKPISKITSLMTLNKLEETFQLYWSIKVYNKIIKIIYNGVNLWVNRSLCQHENFPSINTS